MMGLGTLYSKSSKQKLNTKSSTEAELVGASDFLSQTIWTRDFVEAQGFDIDRSEFYQDNMSAMKLAKNGRASVGQKSRHINIRYFFIKDRIASGEITLLHCPTENMIADFFTKPLQGLLFEKFRDVIMGMKHFSSLDTPIDVTDNRSVLEFDTIVQTKNVIDTRVVSHGSDKELTSILRNTIKSDSGIGSYVPPEVVRNTLHNNMQNILPLNKKISSGVTVTWGPNTRYPY